MTTPSKSYGITKTAPDYLGLHDSGVDPIAYGDGAGTALAVGQLASEDALNYTTSEAETGRQIWITVRDTPSAVFDTERLISQPAKVTSVEFTPPPVEPGNDTPSWPEEHIGGIANAASTILPFHSSPSKYTHTLEMISFLGELSKAQQSAASRRERMSSYGDRLRFRQLADEWVRETIGMSVLRNAFLHRAYQQIIGMGPVAIPLLLEELRDRPEHWMWALEVLTNEDPAASAQTFATARARWLSWGQQRGYLDADQ